LEDTYERSGSDDKDKGWPARFRFGQCLKSSYLLVLPLISWKRSSLFSRRLLFYRRAELYGASLSQSEPRIPLMRNTLAASPKPSFWDPPSAVIGPGIKSLAHSSVSDDLVDILQDMSYLTAFLESFHSGSIVREESLLYFDDERSSIEFRILCLPGKKKKRHGDTEADNIEESCRIAAMIYIKTVFFQVEPTAPIHISLVDRLRIALMQTNLQLCWNNLSELLLWVLFIGATVAQRGPTRLWLLAMSKTVCSYLQKSSWHGVKEILSNYLWSDRILEDRCRHLWLEVDGENEIDTRRDCAHRCMP
jgi:hypothetical protein